MLDDRSFNDLALRLFEYQFRYNERYACYCKRLGVASAPASWEAIPGVPAAAFKEATLATFEPAKAALVFETSGTTAGIRGRHYMETATLYDASVLATFDRFVCADGVRLRYFNLVPNPTECPSSSLGYMLARVSASRGTGSAGWYVRGDDLLVDAFESDVRAAIAMRQPVCLATTAFGLVHLLESMEKRGTRFELPAGSRIMETGGFKGRARSVARDELYAGTCAGFGIARNAIVSEYGMTELASQYYDRAPPARYKAGPPWLRTRVVNPQRATLRNGEIGSLLHVDLANRSSCIAIQTEDLGRQTADGLMLIGREREAALRGCSLDAEELTARTSARAPDG